MLLSEAIRLGAMMGPQLKGRLLSKEGGSCALGAACLATEDGALKKYSGFNEDILFDNLKLRYPVLKSINSFNGNYVYAEIVIRNDKLGQTREQIADWLVESGNDCEAVMPDQYVESVSSDTPQTAEELAPSLACQS